VEVLEVVFWISVAVLVYAQAVYPLLLIAAARLVRERRPARSGARPDVSLIVCAHDEEAVIGAKVANALAQRWPRERLEVIVCSDGSADGTVDAARAAGADLVLDLPWEGKVRAQDAGAAAARGEILAFSDANVLWAPDALAELVAAFDDPQVGYACGRIDFVQGASGAQADNQEDVYWRFEMAVRGAESRFRSITAGNGGIHAVRRDAYLVVGDLLDHDLTFPFSMVKRGLRAIDVPSARASEKMVPSLDGEFARKRRMMGYIWAIVLRSGMLDPRGYGLRYGWMILSHRLLRYSAPAWHVVALGTNAALVALGAGPLYVACLCAQGAVLLAGLAGAHLRLRPLLLARWYVLMNTAMATGLWDHLHGPNPVGWTAPEGTR
jgi:cellulose synthase/poly-beta-1,6-N-acetylglucosamine synthase-like glycosyltransferase